MEELKTRIDNLSGLDRESIVSLVSDIMAVENKEERRKLVSQLLDTMRGYILSDAIDKLKSREQIGDDIEWLKAFFSGHDGYSEIEGLFNDCGLVIDDVFNEVLISVDAEIASLETDLSDVISKANEAGLTTVQYLENEIANLEKQKSDEIKAYNDQIAAIEQELKDRRRFASEDDLRAEISKLRKEQNDIVERSGGYPSDEDERRYHQINEIVSAIEKEINYRNVCAGKSVEELNSERAKLEVELHDLWNSSINSGEEMSEKDRARYDEINEWLKYIDIELERKEKTKYDGYTDEELREQVRVFKEEQRELHRLAMVSGEEMSEKDRARYDELNKLIAELENELKNREDTKYSKFTDQELREQISELEKEQGQLWSLSSASGEVMSEKDQARYHELNKLIAELKEELLKREKDPSRSIPSMSNDDLQQKLADLNKKKKQVQSDIDKKVEELKVKLKKAKRLEALREFKAKNNSKSNEEEKKVEKKEKNIKLVYKVLLVGAGVGLGLCLSSAPGVGVIRMVAAGVKLGSSGVNAWTKKFPESKVAKFVSSANNKIGDKINAFNVKHPGINNAVAGVRNKINNKLFKECANLVINGVSVGYLTGNFLELATGQTFLEHIGNWFEDKSVPGVDVLGTTVVEPTPETTPNLQSNEGPKKLTSIKKEPINDFVNSGTVSQMENIVSKITLEPGASYDLSGIPQGFVSSDATQPVNLMTGAADNLIFDRIVNGRAHFFQANGKGMAWYDLEEVQEYLGKLAEVASKGGKSL